MKRMCPACQAELEPKARFCARCGAVVDAADGTSNVPMHPSGKTMTQARRDVILGWLFLAVGFALLFCGLFVPGWGWRAVAAAILGGLMALVGIGCLVGKSK